MVTLLHLSDVHFGMRDDRGDQERITNALIKAVAKDEWNPDICIFSGDLSFSGDSTQFAEGERWFRALLGACAPTRLFIVPGNHDVVRDDVRAVWNDGHQDFDTYRGVRAKLLSNPSHLESFQAWHAAFKREHPDAVVSDWSDPFGSHATISINGITVQLIGLNTAILSQGDGDLGRLVQDLPTLNTALGKTAAQDCTVAVGHHPLSWLADWNRAEVEKILKQRTGANLYLHGHDHFQSAEASADTLGRSIAVLECGAAYHGANYPQHFSFYRLDFEKREIAPHTYVYSENSGEWVLETGTAPIVAELPWQTLGAKPSAEASDEAPPVAKPVPGREGQAPKKARDEVQDRIELAAWRRRNDAGIAEEKVKDLLRALEIPESELFDQKSRIKEVDSCVRKIMAKRETDPDYSIDQMPDVCGFRLITLFQSGVPEMVGRLLAAAKQGALRSPALRLNQTSGVTIHSSRRDNDPLSIVGAVEEVVRASGLGCTPDLRSSGTGYSSVHVVIDLDIGGDHGAKNWIPVEFQVRTVLEEVWGQLDHKFRYRSGRGALGSSSWQLHLNVVKSQFDTCVQYLDLIKDMATARDEEAPLTVQPSTLTLTRPEQVLEYCRSKSVPTGLLERLSEAFALWKEADGSRQKGGEPGLFRRAADAFGFLLEPPPEMDPAGLSREDFLYIVRMEQAYMLLMSGDQVDLPGAEAIYRQIIADRAEDAAAVFRLGQCLRSLEKFDEAIARLQEAIRITTSEDSEEFYPGERAFIFDRARLSLGTTYFRLFSVTEDAAEKVRLIGLAVETAENVFANHRSPDVLPSSSNDLLYYGWEQRKLMEKEGNPSKAIGDERLMELANLLEEEDRCNPSNSYERDDTLARVYSMLGNGAAAAAAAARVRDWIERVAETRSGERFRNSEEQYSFEWVRRISRHLVSEDEQDALVFALDIWRLHSH